MPLHMIVVVGVDPCDCHVALQRGKWNRGRHRHSHGGLTENMPEPEGEARVGRGGSKAQRGFPTLEC